MVGFDDAGHLDDDVQEKMHRFVWIFRYLDNMKGDMGGDDDPRMRMMMIEPQWRAWEREWKYASRLKLRRAPHCKGPAVKFMASSKKLIFTSHPLISMQTSPDRNLKTESEKNMIIFERDGCLYLDVSGCTGSWRRLGWSWVSSLPRSSTRWTNNCQGSRLISNILTLSTLHILNQDKRTTGYIIAYIEPQGLVHR